ncbi:MAG: phosphatidate cytidylyltransferase [Pseudomonadota bacterium]
MLAAWLAIAWLQQQSPWLPVLLIIIIAAADVGAYFTGRSVGGPKLAPRISPGKTWSGVAGGIVAAFIITTIAVLVLPDSPFSPWLAGTIALGLAAISVGGDLFFSLLKRQRGIKDSSHLLPGHGGILDRIDSLGAALPFFALAVAHLAI